MGLLIDASLLIEIERGHVDAERWIGDRTGETFAISVVTASELLHGVHRARDLHIRSRRSAFVEAVLDRFPLLPIDLATARVHAKIWAGLAGAGVRIGAHDLWIAASALAHGLSVATAKARDFGRVPGLALELWTNP